ncbi:MAG TPA: hypothetical protein VH722_03690 [Alphaproteobacteria bacterium]|jgi:hypothetical protein|nr:hypothetical protein [Alphaproteobacteria bacterium]
MIRADTKAATARETWRRAAVLTAFAALTILPGGRAALAAPPLADEISPRGMLFAQVSYPAPGKEPVARMEFPSNATPISGAEIVSALSGHTAMLPGGFVEYYAPDGSLHGLAEGKHYSGHWEVRNGDFCTLLQDSDADICSPVERQGSTLYWSVDGEPQASPVTIVAGNPQGLN